MIEAAIAAMEAQRSMILAERLREEVESVRRLQENVIPHDLPEPTGYKIAAKYEKLEMAIRRILLLHGVTLSIGGIPLLYMGEEWGVINDYDFVKDPAKSGDTRWVHRPKMKWEFLDELEQDSSTRKRIFTSIAKLIELRKSLPALSGLQMDLMNSGNPHVLAYVRSNHGNRIIVLANFSESDQSISGNALRTTGLGRFFKDHQSGTTFATSEEIILHGYQIVWLERE